MKRRGSIVAGLALLPMAAAVAASGAHRTPVRSTAPVQLTALDIPFKQFVLPNGLTLIVNEDHHQPVAAVGLWYHVGSKDEQPGRTGFAHLFEHLMFSGSEHANDSWFKFTNAIGATDLNGSTAQDRTNFYETVPIGSLDRLLWLESDRMGYLLGAVGQAKLDEQRGVVENEKRQRSNSPYGAVPETIGAAAYPSGHPYSWQPIGSIEDLDAASLADVKTWFRTWYGAGNVVLVISGDVDAEDMHRKVERFFGAVPRGPALHRNDKWLARRTGEKRATLQVDAPEGRIYKVWNVPGYGSRDGDMLDIAATILGEHVTGRLSKRLVIDDKIATKVGVDNDGQELGGLFSISASIRPGVAPARVEAAIDEEVARFLRDGPTPAELDRFKLATYTETVRTAENPSAKGGTLAEHFLYTGDAGSYRASLDRQYRATTADVRDTARAWLSDGVYVLNVTPLPTAVVATDVDRSAMPPIGKPPALALTPPRRFTLSNGLKVELVERHSAPTIAMQLIFRTGMQADRGTSLPETGEMATELAQKGTPTRTEAAIAAEEQALGIALGWNQSNENMVYGLAGLTATLDRSFDLYADLLLHPTFPQDVFDRDRTLKIAAIETSKSTPNGKIARTQAQLLFGTGHPYAATPTAASLAGLTTSGLRDWYRRWVRPDNAVLLIVGDVTESAIRPRLDARLGGWRAPAEPLPAVAPLPPVPPTARPRILLIDQPGAQQSVIAIAGLTAKRTDPDTDSMDIANDVLGGEFVSRLNMNLREDKHWSYGAHSRLSSQPLLGIFSVNTSIQTDKTAAALHEIDRELHDVLTTRRATAKEIEQAKNADVLTRSNSLASASSTAFFYADAIRYGFDDKYWDGYVDRINAITAAQIDTAAAKLVRPNELTWIVVGDLTKIEDGVRQLGIGEVHVIDADGKQLR